MSIEEIQAAIQRAVEQMPSRDKITQVRLFGSYLHGDPTSSSDVDLLIDFDDSARVGYFELVRIEEAFEKALGRDVDLVTPRALSKFFRDEVLEEAKSVYEKR